MATPAWENNQQSLPHDLDNQFQPLWDPLQSCKIAWKYQQRLSLFDSCELEKSDQRAVEVQQATAFRQLQANYENVENQIMQWRQMAAMRNDLVTHGKCNEYLRALIQNSCICFKQPPPIIDSDSKRSRPQVEIRVLAGKSSGIIQDGHLEMVAALLNEEQARHAVEGKGLPTSSEFCVDFGKKPIPLIWDASSRCFRARFNEIVLKKPTGQKWLDGYHIYFYTKAVNKANTASGFTLSTLSTPFEVVSNRTGQKPHKMRNEFWRLAFCTDDSNSSTAGLKPSIPAEPFLDIFDRWFRGFTGCRNGLNEEHGKSISQMLRMQEGIITWERFKKNWPYLYHAAEYVKENIFLWNAGMLTCCFATREEAEKILSHHHDRTMLIRFQQTAVGYLSISFIMPADPPDEGGRLFAHCPLESYFKRGYTLIQCIEYADLLSPTGKRLKGRLRDFKILGTSDLFQYSEILQEDERNRDRLYAVIQTKQAEAVEQDGEHRGPMMDYSSVKERFKIKTTKFPESYFNKVLGSPSMSLVSSISSPPTPASITHDSNHSQSTSMSNFLQVHDHRQPNPNCDWQWHQSQTSAATVPSPLSGSHSSTECLYERIDRNSNHANGSSNQFDQSQFSQNGYPMAMQAGRIDMPQMANINQPLLRSPQTMQHCVPGQQSSFHGTTSPDCAVIFDNRDQQHGFEYDQYYPHTQQGHGLASNSIGSSAGFSHNMNVQSYESSDQMISDDDLSKILDAFDSFNGSAMIAAPSGLQQIEKPMHMNGHQPQQSIDFVQHGQIINDPQDMDFEMADFLVPNR